MAKMKNFHRCKIIGLSAYSKTHAEEQLPNVYYSDCESADSIKKAKHSTINCLKQFRNKRSDNISQGKVVLSSKNVSETMKTKMSLRKRIFQAGRVEKYFRKSFTVGTEERLLKAYKCSLFTTAGPIKGRIFITSDRIAFRSKKLLKLSTSKGEVAKVPYKVSVPLGKIKKTALSENMNKPEEKYVQIVTTDEFEFWFIGFVNYKISFESLHLAIYGEQ